MLSPCLSHTQTNKQTNTHIHEVRRGPKEYLDWGPLFAQSRAGPGARATEIAASIKADIERGTFLQVSPEQLVLCLS